MLAPGARVAQYRIEGNLGAGGMGEVFAAFDERLERRVALKFLPAERELDLVARGRMLREARAASALKHPGIVTIYEIGEAEGRAFIAMELVEGETLATLSGRRGPLPPAEAVALVRQIGDALSVAHEAGILHRDVKTANLMLDPRGHVKVLDFGLSKRLPGTGTPSSPPSVGSGPGPAAAELPPTEADEDEASAGPGAGAGSVAGVAVDPSAPTALPESSPPSPLPPGSSGTRALQSSEPVTVHGARMGTPGSAAIELMRGEEADRRSDVFSLGVVLHELLAGERPFRGADLRALIDAVAHERYEPASKRNPAVGPRLDAVVAKALRARREDRFASIAEMVAAAEAAIGAARGGAGARRRTRALLVVTAGVVLGLGGVVLWATGRGGVHPPTTPAAKGSSTPPTYAPGVPAAAPRALTAQGGCAYSPTFADDRTVVYDYTDAAGANHLWSIPVAGGTPKQLTSGPLTEWRAAPGRKPGEVVYLVNNPASNKGEGAGIAVYDLTTGKSEMLSNQVAASAGFVDGVLHYVRRDGSEVRRVVNGADEAVTHFQNAITARLMTVANDQKSIGFTASATGSTRVCVLATSADEPTCPTRPGRLTNSRPAFSTDDRYIFYAGASGVRRVSVSDDADEVVLDGVEAVGGLAVARDGKYLAYSDCAPQGALFDMTVSPPRRLSAEDTTGSPGAGPNGRVAYVLTRRGGQALMLREPDGTVRQLAGPYAGRVTEPRFSSDGKNLAYFVTGMGLMLLKLDRPDSLTAAPVVEDGESEDIAWLSDGRILFTRRSGPNPGAQVVDPAGGDPAPLTRVPRRVVGVMPRDRVVLLSIDATQFMIWDARAKKETPAPFSPESIGRVIATAMSLNGRWLAVQAGDSGRRVYRFDLSVPHPQPELVFEAGLGKTVGAIALTDEGHVLAAPKTWSGEIRVVEAAAGTRF